MTYQQEMLTRAMSHLDDKLILSAHGPRKKVRRAIPVIITACLVVALIIAFPYLRKVINTDSDILNPNDDGVIDDASPIKPEMYEYTPQDRSVPLGGTTLTLTDTTDTTATFTVVKTDEVPLYALLYDRRGDVLASTEPDYKDNGVTIRPNTLKLYVNGQETPVYRFPTAPGTYEVTVDFSSVRNGPYPMRECIALYAYIGKEEEAVTLHFSLSVEEVTTVAETDGETLSEPLPE